MNGKKPNIIKDKSFAFALRIVKLNKFLIEKKEFILSNQLLRSGAAVGTELNKILVSIIITSKEKKYGKR